MDEITKESYNRSWGKSNLIDNIGIKLPKDLNNFNQVEEVTQKILIDLHIKTNKIYGVLKINLGSFDKYILYCKIIISLR